MLQVFDFPSSFVTIVSFLLNSHPLGHTKMDTFLFSSVLTGFPIFVLSQSDINLHCRQMNIKISKPKYPVLFNNIFEKSVILITTA